MSLKYDDEPRSKSPKRALTLALTITAIFGGVGAVAALNNSISLQDGQMVADRMLIASSQTAVAPAEISEMMDASAKAYITSHIATRNALAYKGIIDGMTFQQPTELDSETGERIPAIIGSGLSSNMNCEALANNSVKTSKVLINNTEAFTASQILAQLYAANPAVKQSLRTSTHLDNYCDVTEVAARTCTFAKGGDGSADTNYSTISSKKALSFLDVSAGVAFIKNIIDPVDARVEGCDSNACNLVTAVNTSYQALGSSTQGAFVNQLNDRMFYEYQNSKAGIELGKSTNTVGAGGGTATPPTTTTPECKPVTTPTTPATGGTVPPASTTNPATPESALPDCPPATGGTTPATGGTTPPATGGTTPPVTGGTTPPATGGTTPPVTGGTTPPATGGTTPPATGGK